MHFEQTADSDTQRDLKSRNSVVLRSDTNYTEET